MKKSLTIALVTILAVASIAFAGQWYVWQYDAASVLGNAYAIAPGISGYQFVPDLVSFTGVDTDTSFEVYSEVDSGVLSAASAITLTTVTIVNATNTAKATAGDIMYKFTGQTSDPNDGTLVWAGEVSSTTASATRGTEIIVRTASDASGALSSGDTIYLAEQRTGDLTLGVEVSADPTVFTRNWAGTSPVTDTTAWGAGASFYPLNYVGRVGKDQIFRVQSAGTLTTTVLHEMSGHYERYK